MIPVLSDVSTYDAILVVGFGGPEGREDVMPFLENVLRGRNVPRERMLEVAEHYDHFGGVSPINGQVRALIAALRPELRRRGIPMPIYWGNRNWHPMLADTLQQMAGDGVRQALAVVLAAYSSYSSCRQYREDIAARPGGRRRGRAPGGQDARLLQSSRLHRRQRRPRPRGPRASPRRPPGHRPPGLHGAQHPERDGRGLPLCRAAHRDLPAGGRGHRRRARPLAARLSEPERPADRPLARARYRRSPARPCRGAGSPTSWSTRSASCRTTWRCSTTWTTRRGEPATRPG